MRVLHTIHSLFGGGAERQLTLLANASVKNGIETAIFYVRGGNNLSLDKGVKLYKISRSRHYYLKVFKDLRKAVREFKPDIIHAWLPATISIPTMILSFLSDTACIFSFRDTMLFRRVIHVPEFIVALICCNRIVSNNPVKHSKWYYRWLFFKKNGLTIPNAIDISDEFIKRSYFSSQISKRKKLLFVGRITKQKNWRCLIDALTLIPSHYPWELKICGNGEDLSQLKKLINETGLFDRVHILGFRGDVYKIMQDSDILIFPSWREGMPNVLLEAFYIGLPCIVSNINSIKSLVQGNEGAVLMFDPSSPNELAKRIIKIFNNPELAVNMAIQAKAIASVYTLQSMMTKYKLFYEEVCRNLAGNLE